MGDSDWTTTITVGCIYVYRFTGHQRFAYRLVNNKKRNYESLSRNKNDYIFALTKSHHSGNMKSKWEESIFVKIKFHADAAVVAAAACMSARHTCDYRYYYTWKITGIELYEGNGDDDDRYGMPITTATTMATSFVSLYVKISADFRLLFGRILSLLLLSSRARTTLLPFGPNTTADARRQSHFWLAFSTEQSLLDRSIRLGQDLIEHRQNN